MQTAGSVPKTTPAADGQGAELTVCSAAAFAEEFFRRRGGKAIVLAEDSAFSAMLPAVRAPQSMSVIWEGDALSLFSLPEGASILAAGGADLLRAARCFSALTGVPCALFPTQAALDGVFEPYGAVPLGGHAVRMQLAAGSLCLDLSLLQNSLQEGFARLMLARLARFEERAVGLICRVPFGGDAYEEAYALTDALDGLSPDEIVRRNARLRQLEAAGLPAGEGSALQEGAAERWQMLIALYTAFFERGRPRRYAVPNYAARAEAAGVPYASVCVPTPETYAARALALERVRGELLAELRGIAARKTAYERTLRRYGGGFSPKPRIERLKTLPERAEGGLCSVMRDFSLMDWEL